MSQENSSPGNTSNLRKQAEIFISLASAEFRRIPEPDVQHLIDALNTQLKRCETENEKLSGTHAQFEKLSKEYRDLYDFAPAGYFNLDVQCNITGVNITASDMLNVPRSKLTGTSFYTLIEPKYLVQFTQYILDIKQTGTRLSTEIGMKKGEGSVMFAQLQSVALYDKSNLTFRVSMTDISGRKLAEDRLKESEQRYRSLFENMLDGFAYCRMLYDNNGGPVDFVYLKVNDAFEKLTGLKNVEGKKVSQLISGIKDSNPEIFEAYSRVATTGIPERLETEIKLLKSWFSISVYSTERDHFVAVFDKLTNTKQSKK